MAKMISWNDKKAWSNYYKKMSNERLIQSVNEHKKNSSAYRGTVLPKSARDELTRRQLHGEIRNDAGKPKRRQSMGLNFGSFRW